MNIDLNLVREHLEKCTVNPKAKPEYDIMAGGLIWEDEIPTRKECKDYLKVVMFLRTIIAYRASLTLDEEREEFREQWMELKNVLPNWPGFISDRIHGEAERILRIHKYKEDKILQELEDELE